jgi:protein Tex
MLILTDIISEKLSIRSRQVETVLSLLEGGATVPFIARYRKDITGALDEVAVQKIQEEARNWKALTERKAAIEKSIAEQDKLSPELLQKLKAAVTLTELEDIYLPFKPKRKTKAQVARENGLEPLARWLLGQDPGEPLEQANAFISESAPTAEDALQGARDIIAEMVNEDGLVRNKMRKLFEKAAVLQSRLMSGKEEEGIKFRDYFDYTEPMSTAPSHRILAVLRGLTEGVLRVEIAPPEEAAVAMIETIFIKGGNPASFQVKKAVKDAYRRLLQPGLENEYRTVLKTKADEDAITVFAENLRQLLLSSPLGSKRILAIDPGYRTGCKVVCLDEQGNLQKTALIYVHETGRAAESEKTVRTLIGHYHIETIAIGDGTAGRETEQFIKKLNLGLPVFLVNEDGASIYSASQPARDEFPDQDITIRGAISIGRRLMDPLAELVKIDPKSIGVGQYQHDVNQYRLKERLDQTVVSCVNAVGVNLNTAGKQLLSYVSGIGESVAGHIVKYRNENGKFTRRKDLLKVPRLGGKAFEQSAGFLRISDGQDPMDASAVHPEAYPVVERMAADLGVEIKMLIGKEALIQKIDASRYIGEAWGAHTIRDILNELKKPGLDPRRELESFEFGDIYKPEDVKPGMIIPGVVTNITRFGAFVDIGVKQDGLVHVSEIANQYITDPAQVLKLNDKVQVKVLEVDLVRKRIALSIKQTQGSAEKSKKSLGPIKKAAPVESAAGSMENALTALKKKFGDQQ